MASRLGSKAASRSATHFGWALTCTDIGSPPRALELWEKGFSRKCSAAVPLHKLMRPYNLCGGGRGGCERRYRATPLAHRHDISCSSILSLHRQPGGYIA